MVDEELKADKNLEKYIPKNPKSNSSAKKPSEPSQPRGDEAHTQNQKKKFSIKEFTKNLGSVADEAGKATKKIMEEIEKPMKNIDKAMNDALGGLDKGLF